MQLTITQGPKGFQVIDGEGLILRTLPTREDAQLWVAALNPPKTGRK